MITFFWNLTGSFTASVRSHRWSPRGSACHFGDRIDAMRASHSVDSPRLVGGARPARAPVGPEPAGESEPGLKPELVRRFEAMVSAHFQPVWRTLFHLGVAEADLDDAAQQVFCTALRRIAEIRTDTERAWLLGVALRVALRFRRTRARRREVSAEALVDRGDQAPGPEDLTDRQVALALIERVLDAMPDDLREVFVLYEIEDLTTPEISELLAIPVGTAASRLRR